MRISFFQAVVLAGAAQASEARREDLEIEAVDYLAQANDLDVNQQAVDWLAQFEIDDVSDEALMAELDAGAEFNDSDLNGDNFAELEKGNGKAGKAVAK